MADLMALVSLHFPHCVRKSTNLHAQHTLLSYCIPSATMMIRSLVPCATPFSMYRRIQKHQQAGERPAKARFKGPGVRCKLCFMQTRQGSEQEDAIKRREGDMLRTAPA